MTLDLSALNDACYDPGDEQESLHLANGADLTVQVPSQPLCRDFMATLGSQVARAVSARSGGEDAAYGLSLTVVPGDQVGQVVPAVVLVLSLPGAIIGDRVHATHVLGLDVLGADQDHLDQIVGGVLESLRAHRSAQLAQR